MVKEYFPVYLIYGFAMINLGIFCLKENDFAARDLPILMSLRYLGWFGIIHGISEWSSLLTIANVYPAFELYLFNIVQILKALSFALLLYFGLELLPLAPSLKKFTRLLPPLLFLSTALGYLLLIKANGLAYHLQNNGYGILTIRYGLALPGGILAAAALSYHGAGLKLGNAPSAGRSHQQLAWILLINGVLEGLIVQRADFFPASLINRESFFAAFGFQTLFLKAGMGILINYVLLHLIQGFRLEQLQRLRQLEQDKIAAGERKKLGLEIHDGIIQRLYAAGLKLEYLLVDSKASALPMKLAEIKEDLNGSIAKVREFMSASTEDLVELPQLKDNLQALINLHQEAQRITLDFHPGKGGLYKHQLSPEKSTQIYYIIQEAITNIAKHSGANRAKIHLEEAPDGMTITVTDNGIGLQAADRNKAKHFGLQSMQLRTEGMGGTFAIKNLNKGLEIKITIPWEEPHGS